MVHFKVNNSSVSIRRLIIGFCHFSSGDILYDGYLQYIIQAKKFVLDLLMKVDFQLHFGVLKSWASMLNKCVVCHFSNLRVLN